MSDKDKNGDIIGRDGHRQRMRDAYLCGNMDNAPEHNLLELFLSIIIPRKDVKQLSYDLINKFGSLEGVIKASPYELMTVRGVGESTAVALSVIDDIYTKIEVGKNSLVSQFDSVEDYCNYCKNLLGNKSNENVYIITLTPRLHIKNCYKVGEGDLCTSNVNMKSIIRYAISDDAMYVLITHNHPYGSAHPSGEDANFTIRLKDMLETINVKLLDHVIVGSDTVVSLKHNKDYMLNL